MFYDWLETNSLPKSAIALWHGLMHINNKAKWNQTFEVAISTIEFKTGFKRSELFEARNLLSQKGRITWKARGGNLSAIYSIIPFSVHNTDATADTSADANGNTNRTQVRTQMPTTNKLKETKLNETSKEDKSSISPVGDAPKVNASFIIDEYNRLCLNLRPVKLLTSKRSEMILARVRQHGLENVIKMFENASKSSFLAGQSGNFSADLDWLIRPNNFVKVLEGKYNDKPCINNGNNSRSRDPKLASEVGSYGKL